MLRAEPDTRALLEPRALVRCELKRLTLNRKHHKKGAGCASCGKASVWDALLGEGRSLGAEEAGGASDSPRLGGR